MNRFRFCRTAMLILLFLDLLAICRIPVSASTPMAVDSTKLLYEAAKYDGKAVVFTGEIIGDVMKRENGTWMNVSDGSNALGIFVSTNLRITLAQNLDAAASNPLTSGTQADNPNTGTLQAASLQLSDLQATSLQVSDLQAGTYRQSGDRVQITGIFHRACPDHGGDVDIHATALHLVAKGQSTSHDIRPIMAATAMLLLLPIAVLVRIILKRNRLWTRP